MRHSKSSRLMSAMGQKQTLAQVGAMSALLPKADMAELELPFSLPSSPASHRCAFRSPGILPGACAGKRAPAAISNSAQLITSGPKATPGRAAIESWMSRWNSFQFPSPWFHKKYPEGPVASLLFVLYSCIRLGGIILQKIGASPSVSACRQGLAGGPDRGLLPHRRVDRAPRLSG